MAPQPVPRSRTAPSVAGTFDTIWRMNEGRGRFTLGYNTLRCSQSDAVAKSRMHPFTNRMFMILGNEQLTTGGCPQNGGYASLGSSIIGGNGIIVTMDFIPGGTSPS